MSRVFRSSLPRVFYELNDPLVVGTWTCEPTSWLTNHPDLADVLETWRESVSGVEPDRHAQVKNGLASARYPAELVESSLRVVREDLRGNEELFGCGSILIWTRHHTKIAWQRTPLSMTCVAEYLKQKESSKWDERKSSDVVAWAFGSPSFVRTWMQKEPKRCLCVGLTLTRAMRIDQTAGLDRSCARSRRP